MLVQNHVWKCLKGTQKISNILYIYNIYLYNYIYTSNPIGCMSSCSSRHVWLESNYVVYIISCNLSRHGTCQLPGELLLQGTWQKLHGKSSRTGKKKDWWSCWRRVRMPCCLHYVHLMAMVLRHDFSRLVPVPSNLLPAEPGNSQCIHTDLHCLSTRLLQLSKLALPARSKRHREAWSNTNPY